MITVTVPHGTPKDAIDRVKSYLEEVQLYDTWMNGAVFTVELGDYVSIDGPENVNPNELTKLMPGIYRAIDGS